MDGEGDIYVQYGFWTFFIGFAVELVYTGNLLISQPVGALCVFAYRYSQGKVADADKSREATALVLAPFLNIILGLYGLYINYLEKD